MAKKPKVPQKRNSSRLRNQLIAIPALAFVVKLGIIARIQGFDWFAASNGDMTAGLKTLLDKNYAPSHVWYGADAENYLRSVLGLFRDGLFSTEGNLHYWPAGYPILIWIVGIIGQGSMLALVAVFQSLLYFIACAFFVNEIRQSRLVNFSWPIALFLSLNPTLALNTIAIGYELPTASLTLIAISALMRRARLLTTKAVEMNLIISSVSFSIATFMQPRLGLMAVALFLIWSFSMFPVKSAVTSLLVAIAIVAIGPAFMTFRNSQAMGFAAISTNLGVTMSIGAGDEATGGYTGTSSSLECPEISGNAAQMDSAKVKCVIAWYASNPNKLLKLAWNKSVYFWSPWFGPVANGTMARNPWRVNHPMNETIKTESGANTVYGNTGKLVSWMWLLGGLFLLFWGTRFLWQAGGAEKLWGLSAFTLVMLNWLSSIATIGDHRFRIPTMGLSVTLQAIGLASLLISKRRRLVGSATEVTWPGLHWKRSPETDNLQP